MVDDDTKELAKAIIKLMEKGEEYSISRHTCDDHNDTDACKKNEVDLEEYYKALREVNRLI